MLYKVSQITLSSCMWINYKSIFLSFSLVNSGSINSSAIQIFLIDYHRSAISYTPCPKWYSLHFPQNCCTSCNQDYLMTHLSLVSQARQELQRHLQSVFLWLSPCSQPIIQSHIKFFCSCLRYIPQTLTVHALHCHCHHVSADFLKLSPGLPAWFIFQP